VSEIEEAKRLRIKAIIVLEQHGVIGALNWAMANSFYSSEGLEVISEKREPGQQQCVRFLFEQQPYKLIRDDEHRCMVPDTQSRLGTVKLYEGELLVFEGAYEIDYEKESTFDFHRDPQIMTGDSWFKSIRLGGWVKHFPRAIEHAKKAQEAHLQSERIKRAEAEARKIQSNFDLGDFK